MAGRIRRLLVGVELAAWRPKLGYLRVDLAVVGALTIDDV
jgi:hypothetical protein